VSDVSPSSASVKDARDFLGAELDRFRSELSPDQWHTLLVGVGDEGDIMVFPCRLVLPFHYPATIAELDEVGPDHFEFPDSSLIMQRHRIPEFAEQYSVFAGLEDQAESLRVSERQKQRRIDILQEACVSFDSPLTVFGIESDTETWWEVNTFYLSGPRIPPPPTPVSDVQILSRLRRHTHSYVGQSCFRIEEGAITEVQFDGADTTDATIDLLRNVPRLSQLLGKLRKISLRKTLVTERSLKFLARELPNLEIIHSHYLDGR
jgi:hypothetical protein